MKSFFSGFFLRSIFLVLAAAVFPAVAIIFFTGVERNAVALQQAEIHATDTLRSLVQAQQSFVRQASALLTIAKDLNYDTRTGEKLWEKDDGDGSHSAELGMFFFVEVETLLRESEMPVGIPPWEEKGALPSFISGTAMCGKDEPEPCLHHGLLVPNPKGRPMVMARSADKLTLHYLLGRLRETPGARMYLMDMGGHFAFCLPSLDGVGKDHVASVREALAERGEDEGSFYADFAAERQFVSYASVYRNETDTRPYAQAAIVIPEKNLQAQVTAMRLKDVLLLSVALGGAVFLSILIVYLLFYPSFTKMLRMARAYAAGQYEVRISPKQPVSEFGELARSMNFMAAALEKREHELIRARQGAEAAGQNKSEFLATMSHEIRTPMNAIIGMAYVALKGELSLRQRGYLTKIYDAASSLLKVINDILELSKLDAGKLRMEKVSFAMREIINEARRHVAMQAHEKGLELNFYIAPNVPRYLLGDPLYFNQVLGHLLENAVRMTGKGKVSLFCELESQSADTVNVLVRVQDTGPGMSRKRLLFLKGLFAGKEAALPESTVGQSAGLGLLLVHRLSRGMNGNVEVESVPGKGTVFSIRIPFGLHEGGIDRHQALLSGMRVMIVDDDPLSLNTIKELLDSFGMRATVLEKAESLVDMLEAADSAGDPFCMVVLDLRMPHSDGLELSRRIRAATALGRSPALVLLSAFGWEDLARQADEIGIDAFLHKPVNESVIFDTILTLLRPDVGSSSLLPVEGSELDLQNIQGFSVLVADDSLATQQMVRALLKDAGATVTVVDDGRKALALLVGEAGSPDPPFDMVMMDIQMPVMNGLETCRAIRGLSAAWAEDLPIVVLTAHASASDMTGFEVAGIDTHAAKTFSAEAFFACIRKWQRVSQVDDPAVAMRIRKLCDALWQSDPHWRKAYEAVEFMLGLHIHEGRLQKLTGMLEAGDMRGAVAYLVRLNRWLGFQ